MQMKRPTTRGRRRGFTLIEVLLVLAILGVIAAMVVPNLLGTQRSSMIKQTKISIRGVENVLRLYAHDHDGNYPQSLDQLLLKEEIAGDVKGPYVREMPKDAWGTPFFYQNPSKQPINQNVEQPDVWSAGPNKQDDGGSGDDINNWTQETDV
ncbi:MAG: type II secretion system protein GspG [Planctomycetes bacterium]|nr:type II secretion system protein GspG [Planctomycetota bacterium]